ncbi:MAG: PAS domain S-box protein, partial [Gaiellaceae bacterium]
MATSKRSVSPSSDVPARLAAESPPRSRCDGGIADATEASDFAASLIEAVDAIVVLLDTRGSVRLLNPAAEEITGYSREELEGRNWFEAIVPRDRYPGVWEEFERLMSGGIPRRFENPIRTKSGEERQIVWRNSELREHGRIVGTASIGIDVTEHKRVEEALRSSEERFRVLIEQAPEAIIVFDAELGRLVDANESAVRLFGVSRDDLLRDDIRRFFVPDQSDKRPVAETFEEHNQRALAGEQIVFERTICNGGGEERICEVRAIRLPSAEGKLLRSSYVDITERKHMEQALRASEERFRRLAENAPDVIYRVRLKPEPAVEFVSPAVESVSGYAPPEFEADPSLFFSLVHPDDAQLLAERLQSPTTETTVLRWLHKDGRIIWAELRNALITDGSGEVVAIEGVLRDITQQTQAEEGRALLQGEFLKAQKMEAVGRLAGGVAHNFRNLLTAIIGYSELALRKLPEGSDVRADVEEIRRAAGRATDVTRGLLVFSRREAGDAASLDLNEVVADVQTLLGHLIGEDVEIVTN